MPAKLKLEKNSQRKTLIAMVQEPEADEDEAPIEEKLRGMAKAKLKKAGAASFETAPKIVFGRLLRTRITI